MGYAVKLCITYPALYLSLALIAVAVLRWALVPSDRRRCGYILIAAIYTYSMAIFVAWFIWAISPVRPLKYDQYIFRIDALFGEPSFRLGAFLFAHPALLQLAAVGYRLLPIACVLVFLAYLYNRPEDVRLVVWTFIANTILAVPIYLLIPVCGPIYAFEGIFPAIPTLAAPHPVLLAAAPNGIPSVHLSTALLVLWFLRHWPVGRVAGAAFLCLTIVATMGCGEHYAFDLLCAIPYTIGIYLLCTRYCTRPRIRFGESAEVSATEFVPS